MYKRITTKSAIQKNLSTRTPYKYSLNPYRGCEHACRYCYALYSHTYLGDDNFFGDIYFKQNIIEVLERELNKTDYSQCLISVGTVCDAYQPLEAQMQFMPKILDLFIKHKIPMYLSTKSSLILRDVDKLAHLSKLVPIYIAVSISTLDDELARVLEPNASPASARLQTAIELKKRTNAFIGIHNMPIIPNLTDSAQNIGAIVQSAKQNNLDYIIFDPLNLRGETKFHFADFLRSHYPKLANDIINKTDKGKGAYKQTLYVLIGDIKNKFGFQNICNFTEYIKKPIQLSFFDSNGY